MWDGKRLALHSHVLELKWLILFFCAVVGGEGLGGGVSG